MPKGIYVRKSKPAAKKINKTAKPVHRSAVAAPKKRGRGRPKGSTNKAKSTILHSAWEQIFSSPNDISAEKDVRQEIGVPDDAPAGQTGYVFSGDMAIPFIWSTDPEAVIANASAPAGEVKQTFEGGSTRSTMQERFDLIPYQAMNALARRLGLGAIKHGDNNWKNGGEAFRQATINHLMKHLANYQAVGNLDDSNTDAIICNAAFLCFFEDIIPYQPEYGK